MADFGSGLFDQVFDAIQVLFAVTNTGVRHWTFDDVTSVHTALAPTFYLLSLCYRTPSRAFKG